MVNVFDPMDEASAALIGKARDGELSDSQFAIELFRDDLERTASILTDLQMTRSIARACQMDGDVLRALLSEEQTAASDRAAECRLGDVQTPADELDSESIGAASNSGSGEPESSDWAGTRQTAQALYRRCIACQEQVQLSHTALVPCDLFRASATDDSLFPPRCCHQPIPTTGAVRILLTSTLIQQYKLKKVEFDTPDRTYCSNPLCAAFIQEENIFDEEASCPGCKSVTCTLCKAASHEGDCPADTALQQVLQTAADCGWQRCFSCRRLVELDIGCNHITCHCGAQFCYVCAQRWKMCACPQWNEERLMSRADQLVARQPACANPLQVREQVAEAAQMLRDRHNCSHESWEYLRGQHRCEECYHTLPSFIFECRQCHIQACKRCRHNRL
ncbi:hypothetical protein BKA61DRAFT_647902 [Leptodontidium sp. MPI-SDFR-AT-0119]|nr:hypothetical protein BKA61DRAFT_647902 [Leptodontidium sp. MPI-SDFR-AT-0119]